MGDEAEDRARLRYLQLKAKAASFKAPGKVPQDAEPAGWHAPMVRTADKPWFSDDAKPKGRMDPESSYFGVPDDDLNFVQKAERKLGDWGLIKPGREAVSPGAMDEKKKAAATAVDTAALGYLPQLAGASDYIMNNDSYLGGRDRMDKYLKSVEGGTKAAGMALGFIPSLMGGELIQAGKGAGTVLRSGGAAAKAERGLQGAKVIGQAAEALPTAGKVFGKAVGTGAAYGFAQNPGDKEGELSPLQLGDRMKNAGKGAAFSAILSAPFAGVQALRERLASKAADSADDVVRIAADMGLTRDQIPTELLTKNQVVRDKAAALKRDPTLGGAMVRKKLQPFDDHLESTANKFVQDAHPVTESGASVGTRVRKQVPEVMEGKLAPAKQAFDELAGPMQKAAPNTQGFKVGTTNLKNNLVAGDSTGELRAIIEREREHYLTNIKTLEDLKNYRTDIGQRIQKAERAGDSREAGMWKQLYGVLTRERDRSLETSVLKSGRKIGAQAKAQQTVQKLRDADQLYAQTSREARDAVGAEQRSTRGAVGTVTDQLDKTSVDKLPDVLWSGKDAQQGANFQKVFPAQHEDIRRLQLQRLKGASSKSGVVSPTTMNTQLAPPTKAGGGGMSPEARGRLLGDNAKKYPDFDTLIKAMPDPNFNPSHTDIRSKTLSESVWHPISAAKSTLNAGELNLRRPLDYVRRGTGAEKIAEKAGDLSYSGRAVLGAGADAAGRALAGPKRPAGQPVSTEERKQKVLQRVQGTPWAAPLAQASERGPDAFAANYYVMSQTYPEFRSLLEDDEDLGS